MVATMTDESIRMAVAQFKEDSEGGDFGGESCTASSTKRGPLPRARLSYHKIQFNSTRTVL